MYDQVGEGISLAFIEEDRTRAQILVGLNYGQLDAGSKSFKRLAHKTKRRHQVEHILKVSSWPGVRVRARNCNILRCVQVPISGQAIMNKRESSSFFSHAKCFVDLQLL